MLLHKNKHCEINLRKINIQKKINSKDIFAHFAAVVLVFFFGLGLLLENGL